MSTAEQAYHTITCDVCAETLENAETETPLLLATVERAIQAARAEGWTVTPDAVSYGPRIVERFAVCDKTDQPHDEARKTAATAPIGRCACCKRVFDPTDKSWNGRAQYHQTGYCRECIDNCHEASADHRCIICAPPQQEAHEAVYTIAGQPVDRESYEAWAAEGRDSSR